MLPSRFEQSKKTRSRPSSSHTPRQEEGWAARLQETFLCSVQPWFCSHAIPPCWRGADLSFAQVTQSSDQTPSQRADGAWDRRFACPALVWPLLPSAVWALGLGQQQ